MEEKAISIAEAKSHLSEYLSATHTDGSRIVITKRGKPFAAIIGIIDLNNLKNSSERSGLSQIIGKWDHFDEIATLIDDAYKKREMDMGRNVSF